MSPRTEFRPLSGALIFAAAARGHLYITWLWWPVGLILVGPKGLQQMEKEFLNSYAPTPRTQQEATDPDLSVKEA